MPMQRVTPIVRFGTAVAFVLVLASCTPGGQFDPTEIFNSQVFDTKTKISGQREPLFPNGVPGTETGVPPDLVKGYQAPPDQDAADNGAPPNAANNGAPPNAANNGAPPNAANNGGARNAANNSGARNAANNGGALNLAAPNAAAQAEAQPKPKPKPKPKLASAPPQKPPTRIDIGLAPKSGAPAQQGAQSGAAGQQTAAPSQSVWPAPPQTAPAQQAAQPAPSIWPNPPAPATTSQ
jgi:hypothetical protein